LRSALLRGRDCGRIGEIESVAEGPAAIALSRGGAAKTYGYVDPNEDSCLFALGEGGVLAAVADGHGGEFGARVLMEAIEATIAPAACAGDPPAREATGWCDWLYRSVQQAAQEIPRYGDAHGLESAPTTLSLAVVRHTDGYWGWCCIGDSHAFRVDASGARDRAAEAARRHTWFLGGPEESWHREATALGYEPLGETLAIALATDGLSERGIGLEDPATAVHEAVSEAAEMTDGRRTQWLARALAERANREHRRRRSGDNIAIAVIGP
jgi:serine/threonine protein phosphatase PrpC